MWTILGKLRADSGIDSDTFSHVAEFYLIEVKDDSPLEDFEGHNPQGSRLSDCFGCTRGMFWIVDCRKYFDCKILCLCINLIKLN